LVQILLTKCVIERWFDIPPHLFIVCTLPWETLRPKKHKFNIVKEHLFKLLAFYLSITFVSHTHSQQMFKILSIFMHACSQLLSPLADGHVNNILLQTVPDVNEAYLRSFSSLSLFIRH